MSISSLASGEQKKKDTVDGDHDDNDDDDFFLQDFKNFKQGSP